MENLASDLGVLSLSRPDYQRHEGRDDAPYRTETAPRPVDGVDDSTADCMVPETMLWRMLRLLGQAYSHRA